MSKGAEEIKKGSPLPVFRILRARGGRHTGLPRARRRHRAAISRAQRPGRCYFHRWMISRDGGGFFLLSKGDEADARWGDDC